MKVLTMSEDRFERTRKRIGEEEEKWLGIRIADFKSDLVELDDRVINNYLNILEINFNDDGRKENKLGEVSNYFSDKEKEEVIEFLNQNNGYDKIIIHCKYGIARSTGLAKGITNYLEKKGHQVELKNIQENGDVYPSYQVYAHFE